MFLMLCFLDLLLISSVVPFVYDAVVFIVVFSLKRVVDVLLFVLCFVFV